MTARQLPQSSEVRDHGDILRALRAFQCGDFSVRMPSHLAGRDGEIAQVFNDIVWMSAAMAAELARLRDQAGREGRIGRRINVPAASGAWQECVESVNSLIGNLVRPTFEAGAVTDAVARDDLAHPIMADARSEVAGSKHDTDKMIRNPAGKAHEDIEQDWLKANLAHFNRVLQGQHDLGAVSKLILTELAPLVNVQVGVVYARDVENESARMVPVATYVRGPDTNQPLAACGQEELIERCALEKKSIRMNDGPVDAMPAESGSGAQAQTNVIILPVLFEGEVKAVIELTSLVRFGEMQLTFLEQLAESVGIVFNTIEATTRTERLLAQSLSLTAELQSRQEELERSNRRLRENATQLSEQMRQVRYKNREVELARAALEEKAEQLALSSRYKTEFLANMSHELRTPLNSLLILAHLLADNPASNLTPKQVEYAQTIYSAGNDLLGLINDVLDLAKVESGTVTLDMATERFEALRDYLDGAFRQLAHDKGLQFTISIGQDLPPALRTDAKRLQQILKNLLSNAFKFTPEGTVSLEVALATSGWTPEHPVLDRAEKVVAFSVMDTGIGISPDKQQIIFAAFQQADGTTSRHYGGTGLGLSISSKLSNLLGGEIGVQSSPSAGSTFTLYLPLLAQNVGREDSGPENGWFQRAEMPVPEQIAFARPADADMKDLLANPILDEPSLIQRAPAGDAGAMPELAGTRVLLVDDDIRNIFALSSALEEQGMIVMNAESGPDGIRMLQNHPEIDIVLIDMMMPDMDGYETIRAMRGLDCFKGVPIIGISARAMKGDREKCIAAGASDYMSKPVNVDHLLSLIREWLIK